jgi:hypothetical protein
MNDLITVILLRDQISMIGKSTQDVSSYGFGDSCVF